MSEIKTGPSGHSYLYGFPLPDDGECTLLAAELSPEIAYAPDNDTSIELLYYTTVFRLHGDLKNHIGHVGQHIAASAAPEEYEGQMQGMHDGYAFMFASAVFLELLRSNWPPDSNVFEVISAHDVLAFPLTPATFSLVESTWRNKNSADTLTNENLVHFFSRAHALRGVLEELENTQTAMLAAYDMPEPDYHGYSTGFWRAIGDSVMLFKTEELVRNPEGALPEDFF